MQGRHATHGIEDRRGVVHQLQVVAVTGHQKRLKVPARLRGQRGHDVVSLEVFAGQRRNPQGSQDLTNELDLAAKLLGRRLTLRLILGEHLRAEGCAAHVERHCHEIRLLLSQDVGQHGKEAVDGVGVLATRGGEVLRRQCIKCAEGHRVAVDKQESGQRSSHPAHPNASAHPSQPALDVRDRRGN